MSFADELRDNSLETQEKISVDHDLAYWCGRLTGAIKAGCRQAAKEGRRSIHGYVYMFTEDGAEKEIFVGMLPKLRDQETRTAQADRSVSANPESTLHSQETAYPNETRLYQGFIIPGDVSVLQRMEKSMGQELENLGFTDYRVQKVMLMDVYIIRRSGQTTYLTGLKTRTAPEPVYTLHFSISW